MSHRTPFSQLKPINAKPNSIARLFLYAGLVDINQLADSVPFIVWGIDASGVVTFSKGRKLEEIGRLPDDTRGKNVFAMLPPDSPVATHLRLALNGEEVSAEVQDKDLIYESYYLPQRDPAGAVFGVVIFSIDITHRKRTEQALVESEAHFRSSIENMLEPFVIYSTVRDPDGKIIDFLISYANAACRAAMNIRMEAIVGQRLSALLPGHWTSGLFESYRQVVETGEPLLIDGFEFEEMYRGSRRTALLDIRAARVGDGLIVNWRNLTDRKRMQADVAELQRSLIESAEKERRQLAHTLHDGPVQDLYAIDFQLHDIAWQADNTETGARLNEIQAQLHQVIETLLGTVSQLRPFSLTPFGLKAAILSHLDRFTAEHPEFDVVVDLDDDQDLLSQTARLGLYRIYQHMINNIERHASAARIAIRFKLDGCQAVLSIEDNGSGFDVPDRLVTLVREGRLGIATAFDQMVRLGGQFSIQSSPGQGTIVTARLPI